jgi:hypothetical protein
MLKQVAATHFVRIMTDGRTCPILCGCTDGSGNFAGEFVVKLLGQPATNGRGALYEFVGSRLADHFGILTLEAAVVDISPAFAQVLAASQPRLTTAIQSNIGLNFATRVANPMTTWFAGRGIPEAMLQSATDIFAFDALIQNPDRRVQKPNVFTRGDDLYVYDHEMAFSFLLAIGNSQRPWELDKATYLNDHVFYTRLKSKKVSLGEFKQRLHSLSDGILQKIRGEIPAQWLHTDLNRIENYLIQVREHSTEFVEHVKRRLA